MISATALTVVVWIWQATLLAVFLAHRGADVGQLPNVLRRSFATLWGPPLVEARAFAETVGGAVVASLIVGAWYGFGGAVERVARRVLARGGASAAPRAGPLERARTCAVGAGCVSLFWFSLGVAGLYRRPVAVAMLVGGLALCVVTARRPAGGRAERDAGGGARSEGATAAAWTCVLFPVVLAGVAAAAPPTGKDALIYHLALPKTFVAAGGLVDVPHNIPSFYPLGAEMHGVWALLLGGLVSPRVGEAAAGLVAFAFLPLVLAAVYGWARAVGIDRGFALTAAALVASVPTAYYVASSAYVDLALTLYATLALEAAGRWWVSGSRLALVHLALALGGALSVKLLGAFVLVPLPLLMLLRARRVEAARGDGAPGAAAVLGGGAGVLAVAALLACPWYVRTWLRTGSPLFPFFLNVWPAQAPGWDAHRSDLLQAVLAQYGGDPKTFLDYVAAPLYVSLVAQPELAAYYDGVLGIAFLGGLPFLFHAWRRTSLPAATGVAAALAALFVALWLASSSHQLRFLLPALPALAVAIAAGAAAEGAGRAGRWALLAATLAGQLVIAAWFLEASPLRAALGGEPRDAYLARRLDHYAYYQLVNSRLPAEAKVWLINMRRDTYHLDRPHFADYLFEDHTLREWVAAARDAGEVRERARRAGITHVLVRHDVLLHPATAPFAQEAKLRIIRSFLVDGARILRADARFLLVELPRATAPPRGAS